ncbi:hypothetical protein MTO96_023606 [Rhipicephalus appendiculatus]
MSLAGVAYVAARTRHSKKLPRLAGGVILVPRVPPYSIDLHGPEVYREKSNVAETVAQDTCVGAGRMLTDYVIGEKETVCPPAANDSTNAVSLPGAHCPSTLISTNTRGPKPDYS